MPDNSKQFLPLDLWESIAQHLHPQDLVNASMACRHWYKELAHQSVWEVAYGSILCGYPTEHFLVPDLVEKVERPDFIPLYGGESQVLERWSRSYKQRIIYLLHVMYVQSNVIRTMKERSSSFSKKLAEPYYSISRINEMEAYLKSIFPIDLIVFMTFYAHQVRTDHEDECSTAMSIASGWDFDGEDNWKDLMVDFHPRQFDRGCRVKRASRLANISSTTKSFLQQMKFAPFSKVSEYECEGVKAVVSVMLSKNDQPPPMLPESVINSVYTLMFENTPNSAGKVFYQSLYAEYNFLIEYISESFTDYFIQYAGVALQYGEVPDEEMKGAGDLSTRLPRDDGPRQSILLPQPIGWDIGNYFPTYFTAEKEMVGFRHTSVENCMAHLLKEHGPVPEVDNPDHIPIKDPPSDLFYGCSMNCWKPYHDFLKAENPSTAVNRLADFGYGKCPPVSSVKMNQDIYDILRHMVRQWMSSTACKFTAQLGENFTCRR